THKTHIAIHPHSLRQSLAHEQLSHRFQGGLGMKIGAHLCVDEHRGSLIDHIEDFYPMLPLASDFWRHGRGLLEIELPLTQRCGTLLWLLDVRESMGDASSLLQDAVDRSARAGQACSLQLLIAWQVVHERFGPRRAPQALRQLFAHLEDAIHHTLADALWWVQACP